MAFRMNLSEEHDTQIKTVKGLCENEFPEPSCVSMKTDWSMDPPTELSIGDSSADLSELKSFRRLLSPDYPECSERDHYDESHSRVREGLLKITLHILRKMNQTNLANTLQTKIYITEGGSGEVNNEHDVRQIERVSRRPKTQETPIICNDIFKPSPGQDKPIRTVLTKGVAGIGKTVSVRKFILDLAEGKANRDVHFIFPLPFRELNLIQKNLSLVDLLNHFHTETKEFNSADYDDYNVMFIFDGLDECQLCLDFQNSLILSDVTESVSVDVLLINLIKRNLLPSALLWITSRPAAANQIPPECVDQVTEVRGFNDPQKDGYFRKRINDQSLADRIVTHIRSSRSLYIMCHIPVFCWISATVLERMMGKAERPEIPKTLTQMFTHFLIFQTKLKTQKYDEREEFGLQLGKVYSFVHVSIQECLAALFKLLSFSEQKTGLENDFMSPMTSLLKGEVDKALQSENGHWDLFLRFLLGLSLESNQTLLQGLLTKTVSSSDINQETADYIKQKIRENPSPEQTINLFHFKLSPAQWSTLVFVLLNSEERLDEFILSKYDPSEECLLRLLPVIKASRKADLSGCGITERGCAALISALRSNSTHLRELNLSDNKLRDPGVKLLSALLKDPHCKLEKLELWDCRIGIEGCAAVISDLRLNPSHLRELNLSWNKPGDSGVKLLYWRTNTVNWRNYMSFRDMPRQKCLYCLRFPTTRPELKLGLWRCSIGEEGCAALISAMRSNSSHLRELNLNGNKPGESRVKLLSALLEEPHCKLKKL
ncbi:NLR family CARD domain-containing protein 3 [Labeo rohita]|uniref:NLR family CARD domain-containing protein 3 n=1 Tax=Labeo rohita TaxID=84645 RepID=A0ABQ8LHV9_LABRO|nr:NLR family CARD domain-containing protein 3 [Labeo rohita]